MTGYIILAIVAAGVIARSCQLEIRREKLEMAALEEPLALEESPAIARRLAAAREYVREHGLTPCYSSHFRLLPGVEPNAEIARATVERIPAPLTNPEHALIAARIRAKYALAGALSSQEVH